MMKSHIRKAIQLAGGARQVAATIGTKTPQVVHNWIRRGNIPPRYVLDLERLSGISRHDLRPDLYPREAA